MLKVCSLAKDFMLFVKLVVKGMYGANTYAQHKRDA